MFILRTVRAIHVVVVTAFGVDLQLFDVPAMNLILVGVGFFRANSLTLTMPINCTCIGAIVGSCIQQLCDYPRSRNLLQLVGLGRWGGDHLGRCIGVDPKSRTGVVIL